MSNGRLLAGARAGALPLTLACAVLGVVTGGYVTAGLAGGAAALIALPYAWDRRPRRKRNDALFDKVANQIEHGRKLVIYERDTGLYAQWYISLRGDEECTRAERYGRPLTMLVIEPRADAEPWAVQNALTTWLSTRTRATDLVGYLGAGRYVIIMPETPSEQMGVFHDRMGADALPAEMAFAQFPADGATFDDLYAAASARLVTTPNIAA